MTEADQDLMDIWFYGYWNFGINHADQYIQKLTQHFSKLDSYELGNKRSDLGNKIYAMPHREHVIFYRTESEKVFIVRILHHSQDAVSRIALHQWF